MPSAWKGSFLNKVKRRTFPIGLALLKKRNSPVNCLFVVLPFLPLLTQHSHIVRPQFQTAQLSIRLQTFFLLINSPSQTDHSYESGHQHRQNFLQLSQLVSFLSAATMVADFVLTEYFLGPTTRTTVPDAHPLVEEHRARSILIKKLELHKKTKEKQSRQVRSFHT